MGYISERPSAELNLFDSGDDEVIQRDVGLIYCVRSLCMKKEVRGEKCGA